MAQEVLYRKWRPRRFADVAGQDPVTTTMRNAVAAGTPAHAYLFCGPRGTGKTTTGRILAKAVNCASPQAGEPCEACPSCISYNEGRAIDLIELDAASNRGIDEIRDLREGTGYAPAAGRYKVYLIDEVHMLTDAAFNALLKTLEEPPPHVIFILATTEAHRIPATILSRCQRFDLRRISVTAAVQRLETIGAGEGFTVAAGGYELIARQATGSLRDAVNLLDQLVAFHGTNLSLDDVRAGLGLVVDDRAAGLARASVTRDLTAGLNLLAGARDDGVEVRAFLRETVAVLRSLLMFKAGAGDRLGLADAQADEIDAIAVDASVGDIVAALEALSAIDFAGDAYDSLPAEIAFAMLCTGVTTPAAAIPVPPSAAPRPAPSSTEAPRPVQRPAAAAPRAAAKPVAARPVPQPSTPPPATPAPPSREFAPTGGGEATPDLATLKERWSQVQEAMRAYSRPVGALFTIAYPKSADGQRVAVGLPHPPQVEKAQNQDGGKVLQALTAAVTEALGHAVEVNVVHWPELGNTGNVPSARPALSHLIEEAMKQGAEPISE
ncbi:MAG: DNA polymerase III subunit gamma/tau [Chloroflexi bacterium]|nr:MAG: DNA polymerase III subunit gamma/tau [Chloroflexota bacterium]